MSNPSRRSCFLLGFVWTAILFACTGATCMPRKVIPDLQPPAVFSTPPSVEQLAEVLNRSNQIQSLQSNSVSIRVNNQVSVNANLTWLRPSNFRMNATVAGVKVVDMGSNPEVFWMTIREGLTPVMYFARHSEFENLVDRPILPVSPLWLVEALGIVSLDPYQMIQAPVMRPDGRMELTTTVPSPIGNFQRILVVEPMYGITRQVFLKDPVGRQVAVANQSKHEYYSAVQTSLPHQIQIQLSDNHGIEHNLEVTIGSYVVNGMSNDPGTLFAFPNTYGFESRNLVELSLGNPNAVTPVPIAPPRTFPHASYRGVPWDNSLSR